MQQRLASATEHCAARGAQLTPQRAEVLELLLRRGGQAKAYDLQGDMQARHGRIAPTTVYRALDFLQEHHLVHKVDAENGVLLIKGAIPGRTGGLVMVRTSVKRGEAKRGEK